MLLSVDGFAIFGWSLFILENGSLNQDWFSTFQSSKPTSKVCLTTFSLDSIKFIQKQVIMTKTTRRRHKSFIISTFLLTAIQQALDFFLYGRHELYVISDSWGIFLYSSKGGIFSLRAFDYAAVVIIFLLLFIVYFEHCVEWLHLVNFKSSSFK